jgi:hypothetical protein
MTFKMNRVDLAIRWLGVGPGVLILVIPGLCVYVGGGVLRKKSVREQLRLIELVLAETASITREHRLEDLSP